MSTRIELEYPYNERWRKGYIVTNPEGRKTLILFNNKDDRSSTQYARYLLAVKLGRFLAPEETVDHIDGNKNNNKQYLTQRLILAFYGNNHVGRCFGQFVCTSRTHLPIGFNRCRTVRARRTQFCSALRATQVFLFYGRLTVRTFHIGIITAHDQINDKTNERRCKQGDQRPQGCVHSSAFCITIDIYAYRCRYCNTNTENHK